MKIKILLINLIVLVFIFSSSQAHSIEQEKLEATQILQSSELSLKKLIVIVTLGKVAFDNCIKLYKNKFKLKQKFIFKHGKTLILPNGLVIIPSYHPSPRNVNTKLISEKMMISLFKKAKKLAKF